MMTSENNYYWNPITSDLSPILENGNYAAVLLNHSFDHLNGKQSTHFESIWERALVRIGVDGGCNLLKLTDKKPDIISGDFDSISPKVLDAYRSIGSRIVETPDQDATDFTKAVRILINEYQTIKYIIAFWSSSGRIDQILANIDTLHKYNGQPNDDNSIPIFLLQVDQSISWLLNKGSHVIKSNHSSRWCSLVPIGSQSVLTTTGLRWNLNEQTLAFGSLISTSNEFDKNEEFVNIKTDRPILFSMDIETK